MGLEIKTFVHGASKGHKMWPEDPAEKSYTVTFYSTTWTTKGSMLVEVRTCNDIPYCYYSYIRGGEVHGADDRPGSYFAITLRLNTCYTDLQNMYHLLRAAYEKVCVGMCIEEHDSFAQITTEDFGEKENELKQMQKGLVDYIFQFSRDSDLAPLSGFQRSNGTDGLRVNDSEARGALVLNALKRTGRVVVSHLFDTSKVTEVRKQADQAMQQCQADAARRIQQAQSNAAASIEQAKKNCINEKIQLEQDLQQERLKVKTIRQEVQNECDKQIKDIRAQYASCDKKMSDLRRVIEQKDGEIKQKDNKIKQLNNSLASKDKQIQKLSESLTPATTTTNAPSSKLTTSLKEGIHKHPKVFLFSAVSILTLALLFIVSQSLNLCHTRKSADAEVTERGDSTATDSTTTEQPAYMALREQIQRDTANYNFSIDVKEISKRKTYLDHDKPATISLIVKDSKGKNVSLDQFVWFRDIEFSTDCEEEPVRTIFSHQPGTYTLVYKAGDTEIARRDIEVK